jgi:hypothetical protein
VGAPEGDAPLKDPTRRALNRLLRTRPPEPPEPEPPDAHVLLSAVAAALNACEAAGFPVILAKAVMTPVGYVIPVFDEPGGRYAVRTMALTEFPPIGGEEDD